MSVKIFYDTPSKIAQRQLIGGFCYCRRIGVGGKPTDRKPYVDPRVAIDTSDPKQVRPDAKPDKEHPIVSSIDFGIVPVETSVFRDFFVYSSSGKGPKTLTLEPQTGVAEPFDRGFRIVFPAYELFPDVGCGDGRNVGKGRKLKFRLYFEPELPTMHYASSMIIMADNIPILLECQGLCDGPSVCFSENVINFGGQYYRDESRFKVKMNNASACEAKFQFDNDNVRSTFKICPSCGVIPPFSTINVEVLFQATKPQSYYKRVMCLIHHQHPQYLDLIGICIPRPFFASSPIDFGLSIAETLFLPLPTDSNDEYFNNHSFWGVTLSDATIDFGYRDVVSSTSENSSLSLTSTLPYDVVIDWIPDPTNVFQITPNNIILPAGRSAIVDVSFRPTFPDSFFSGQLECYIRPTEYTWAEQHGPPWIYSHKEELLDPNAFDTTNEPVQSLEPDVQVPLIELYNHPTDLNEEDEEEESGDEAEAEAEERFPKLSNSKRRMTIGKNSPGLLKSLKRAANIKERERKKGKPKKGLRRMSGLTAGETLTDTTNVDAKNPSTRRGTNFSKSRRQGLDSKGSLNALALEVEPIPDDPEQPTEDMNSAIVAADLGNRRSIDPLNTDIFARHDSETLFADKDIESKQPKKQRRRCSTFIDEPFTLPLILTLRHAQNVVVQSFTLEPITHLVDTLENPSLRLSVTTTSVRKWSLAEAERVALTSFLNDAAESLRDTASEMEYTGEDEANETEAENQETISKTEAPQPDLTKRMAASGLPEELALPLCLSVRVTGHTYQRYPLVTRVKIPKAVTMYPTWPKSQVCRTFMLRNNNDLPVAYDASVLAENGTYVIKPSKGLIPGKFHQLILVQMTTKLDGLSIYSENCDVAVNTEDKNTIMLRGMAESPTLEVLLCYEADIEGRTVVFPETVPGCSAETCLHLKNPSRFHYKFDVKPIAKDDANVFFVTPSEGFLVPYQTLKLNLQFLPVDNFDYYSIWKFTFYLMRSRIETRNVVTSYIFEIPFVATCRDSLLMANPKFLDFELVEIFSTKTLTFTLQNTGHASISANLRAMHEEWLQWYPSEQIAIEPQQLFLNGLESAEISVTVRPDETNFQRFFIDYELELNETANKSVQSIHEDKGHKGPKRFHRICELNYLGDHATFCVTDILMISRHPVWDAGQSWSMFSIDRFNHVLKPSNNHSTKHQIPSIPTITFRFPPATIDAEPALFNILLSNRDTLGGTWQMMPSPPKEWIKSLFSQRRRNSKLNNFGTDDEDLLKEIWKQKFISMSQDVDEDHVEQTLKKQQSGTIESKAPSVKGPPNPVSLMNMLIQHLTDMEYFYVSPIGGLLTPGEQMQISLRYSYKHVGKHQMTVLFRIQPGVFVWVAMKGMTLPPDTAYVQHMHREEMLLHPISLADMDPPIQLFWMYNGGDVSTEFQVVTKPFEECPDMNYGHEVFECLNPKGVIGAKGWAAIRIRFSPIEIKEYSIPLIIAVNGKLTRVVLLKGIPSFSQGLLIRPEVTGFHMEQKFVLINPLIPIMLSPAHVIFKKFIPTGQKATSVVFLTNLSNSNIMSYTWPNVLIDGGGSIIFEPENGILRPSEEKACMAIVTGGKASTTFSRVIRIAFVDETLLAEYELKMRDRDSCRARLMGKKMSDADVRAEVARQLGSDPEKPPSFSRLISITVYISSSFGILNTMDSKEQAKIPAVPRCKPLPPSLPGKPRLTLPPFAQQLSREIISSILWDLMNSDSMESFIKDGAGIKAPLFSEYKRSEDECIRQKKVRAKTRKSRRGVNESDEEPGPTLPVYGAQVILEQVVFNMIQEVATTFEPRQIPEALKPVQPRQLVNVKRYRNAFT